MSQLWYFEKKDLRNTPSSQAGVDSDLEARYRKEGAQFIIDMGRNMQLSPTTVATAVVYFHRFYMKHSFNDFPRYPTCCACIFLAGKVEETPKKCKDIIKYARIVLPDSKFAQFKPGIKNPYDEVMTLESILLKTIKFGIEVAHPHTFILKYAKSFKGEKKRLQKIVQMAWVFANDSLGTTLCLQWQPEIIAIALIHLAGKLSRFEIMDWDGKTIEHRRWWDMFVEDMTLDVLEDICHQVLDIYCDSPNTTPCESPPPFPCPPIPIISTHFQPPAALSSSPLKDQSTRIQIGLSSKTATPVASMTLITHGTPGPTSEVMHPPSTPVSKAFQPIASQQEISVSSRSIYQKGKSRTDSASIPTASFSRKKSCYSRSPLLASKNYHTPPPTK